MCVRFSVVLVLAVLLGACGGAPQQSTQDPTQTPYVIVITPTALPATPTQAAIPSLGDTAESGGYSLAALTVEDPATATTAYTPKADTKLIAIEVVIGNVSGEQTTSNPLNATLVDSEGFVHEAELGARAEQLDVLDLAAGEKVRGWIAFTIPVNATAQTLKYKVPGDLTLQVSLQQD
jgi:hypothetical protein